LRSIPQAKGFYGGKWHWTRGVQDCSSNYDVLDDPRLPGFIEESEAIDLPIIFEEDLAFTETFVGMTKKLKIIIPHLGLLGGNPLDFLETFKGRDNVYFDTALAGQETIGRFVREIGAERILFASDIPFGTMRNELAKVLSLPIGDAEKELILSKNVKRLIGLD
jgi:predicted TIM-barrel fold metal-dependent hydrolase